RIRSDLEGIVSEYNANYPGVMTLTKSDKSSKISSEEYIKISSIFDEPAQKRTVNNEVPIVPDKHECSVVPSIPRFV
ncbi:MAG TPA: hypothetical protein VHZ76_04185, partial [Gammaproteobacteria bacterium]|nr:hypothetical protein [Gammaproteobacteria bacterium]